MAGAVLAEGVAIALTFLIFYVRGRIQQRRRRP
jgi:hypothetical protein